MRNRFAGECYRCGHCVAPGAGHFERHNKAWRTQHAECAIWWRGQQPTRDEASARYLAFSKKAAA